MSGLRKYAADERGQVSPQHRDGGFAADAKHSGEHVQDLYTQQVLGVHGEESAAGALGSHSTYRHPYIYGGQHGELELRIEFV
jgi:hypothetical protein